MPKKTSSSVPDSGSLKRLRKICKRGSKFTILAVRGDRHRKFGPTRAFIPLGVVKGKVVNLSVDVTNVVDLEWSGDNTIRSISDPYHMTRLVAVALHGDEKALTAEVMQ